MGYGEITTEMEAVLRPLVKGKVVYDLGAGDLHHARHLLQLGARRIVAIDKGDFVAIDKEYQPPSTPRIETISGYFDAVPIPPGGIEVAFVCWPCNRYNPGLVTWLEAAEYVIYIGSNFDGTACGSPDLFEHLLRRRLTGYVPHRRNSLVAVAERLPEPRETTPEEAAARSPTIRHGFAYDDESQLRCLIPGVVKALEAQVP